MRAATPADKCAGCKHAISVQGYFHACNNPQRLLELKRLYYVDRIPVDGCYVQRPDKSGRRLK